MCLKTVISTTLSLFLVISCSSDDDNNEEQPISNNFNAPTTIDGNIQEDLLGRWQILSITEDGKPEELDECDLKETVTFTEANGYFGLTMPGISVKPCHL